MKHTLLLALSLVPITVCAQFNTISNSSILYSIEVIEEENRGKEIPLTDVEASPPISTTDTIFMKEGRQKWIDQYMSVSYPLKEMCVTSPYGMRKDPFTGKATKHNGIDLRANYEDVKSMMFGKVAKVGSDKRSGKFVKIRYAECEVTYCHLSSICVRKGQLVDAGEIVATSGNTGRSTGPHLHLSIKYKGKHADPFIFLDFIEKVRQEALNNLTD